MVENPKDYWTKRYAKQGELTTGFCGHNEKEMDASYKERFDWLDSKLGMDRCAVLDFGCGTGRYSSLFSKGYIPYDPFTITNLIKGKKVHRTEPKPPNYYVLFTSTVLQHNTDKEVERILKKYRYLLQLWLYEFTGVSDAPHMASRTVQDYERLSCRNCFESHSHITHGQEHTLMKLA